MMFDQLFFHNMQTSSSSLDSREIKYHPVILDVEDEVEYISGSKTYLPERSET